MSTYQLSANAYRHSIMDLFTNLKPGYLALDYTTAVGSTVVARFPAFMDNRVVLVNIYI